MNTFYRSRKFAYALGTFLAALLLVALPLVAEVNDETMEMLKTMLPLVFVIGILVITGHTVTDVMAVWTEGVQYKDLRTAAHDLIDAAASESSGAQSSDGVEFKVEGGEVVGVGVELELTPESGRPGGTVPNG